MPTRRLSMRKIKEVLRLRFELKMGQREIARACSISQSTVHEYLKAATAAGVSWPLPEGGEESRLEAVLFGKTPTRRTEASARRSRFSFLARSAAASPAFNATVGLGRIPASEPRGLSLQLVLQTLPTMASEAGCGSTPGVQSRREGVRGLGRSDAPSARSDHRSDLASIPIRNGAGSEFLHLRRS